MCGGCTGEKCCVMFWCFVYMWTGLAILGVGIWKPIDPSVYSSVIMEEPDYIDNQVPWRGVIGGLIALGLFCTLCGVLGMSGASCNNHEAVVAFLVLGAIGTIASIALFTVATIGYTSAMPWHSDDTITTLEETYRDNLKLYYQGEDTEDDFSQAWNGFQSKWACCGVHNYTDYQYSVFNNKTGLVAPWSCCIMEETGWNNVQEDVEDLVGCREEAADPPDAYEYFNPEGCDSKLIERSSLHQMVVMGTGWAAVLLQVISMIVAGCLKHHLKRVEWMTVNTNDAFK